MYLIRLITCIVALSSTAVANTEISGIIERDMTWSRAGGPYVVTANVLVAEGATVTIEPGVTVMFRKGTYLKVDGTLIAEGTADERIRFTSGVYPQSIHDWLGIRVSQTGGSTFDASTNRVGGTIFKHVEFHFAQQALQFAGGGLVVDSCLFQQNHHSVVFTGTRHMFVRGNRFRLNTGYCIQGIDIAGELYDTRITGNEISESVEGVIYLEARNLTWVEVGFNRTRGVKFPITLKGRVPHDVKSVHVHHNHVDSAYNGLTLGLSVQPHDVVPLVDHALIELNIFSSTRYNGLLVNATLDARIHARSNTFAGGPIGVLNQNGGPRTFRSNTFVGLHRAIVHESFLQSGDTLITVSDNTFAYSRGVMVELRGHARTWIERNDFIPSALSRLDSFAVRNFSRNAVEAMNNYWGGSADSSYVSRRIYDSYDDFETGRVRFMPLQERGTFIGPLVPPSNATVLSSANGGGSRDRLVTWQKSPDPRVGGYRVWFDRRADGSYARSMDFGDTTRGTIPGDVGGTFSEFALTAFVAGAGGHFDQLEGRESWFDVARNFTITSVGHEGASSSMHVGVVVPNPSSGHARLGVSLRSPASLRVAVMSGDGSLVRSLGAQDVPAGRTTIVWDGRDESGSLVANGVYWLRVTTGAASEVRPVVIAR